MIQTEKTEIVKKYTYPYADLISRMDANGVPWLKISQLLEIPVAHVSTAISYVRSRQRLKISFMKKENDVTEDELLNWKIDPVNIDYEEPKMLKDPERRSFSERLHTELMYKTFKSKL